MKELWQELIEKLTTELNREPTESEITALYSSMIDGAQTYLEELCDE
jgi:hypothetical protein